MTHVYSESDFWQPPLDSAPAALELRGVCVQYDGVTVLDDVSLTIPAGSLVAVIGPNGAGKTTLLKTLVGLVPRAAGQVLVRGAMLDRRACQVAYVPQRTAVNWRFPASVFDVVLMGRYGRVGWLRRPGPADRAYAEECLEQVGMLAQRNRPIAELSGGQQQRVFMARALAQEPEVLLLDEPISGVDAPTQEVILDLLAAMARAGKTLLLTTHDLRCSIERFDAMLCLRHKLIAYGSPTQVLTPGVLAATYGTNLVLADGSGATFVHA